MCDQGSYRIPHVLTFDGNVKEKWQKWEQKFRLYLLASGLSEKLEERQVAVLLNVIGEEALEKFNTFGLSEDEKKELEKVLEDFGEFCTPKANKAIDRHVFNSRNQLEGENFMTYLTALKKLSASCNFGEL